MHGILIFALLVSTGCNGQNEKLPDVDPIGMLPGCMPASDTGDVVTAEVGEVRGDYYLEEGEFIGLFADIASPRDWAGYLSVHVWTDDTIVVVTNGYASRCVAALGWSLRLYHEAGSFKLTATSGTLEVSVDDTVGECGTVTLTSVRFHDTERDVEDIVVSGEGPITCEEGDWPTTTEG